jgi:transposase
MSVKHGKRYTPRFKFQVVMETLRSSKAIGQIAKVYGVQKKIKEVERWT